MAGQYVVVFPNGFEYFGELDTKRLQESLCNEAVHKSGLTTTRKARGVVAVQVFRLDIKDGKLGRTHTGDFSIELPYAPMTHSEYEAEMAKLLEPLAVEFHPFVWHIAYEHGHSSGYDEVVNILVDCVAAYNKRVLAK